MFCPNCGTQNDENNAKCQKCGFSIKGALAPKFKGTMLMMNAPPAAAQRIAPPGVPGAAPMPPPSPVAAPAPPPKKPLAKMTMIGVAPPSPGAVIPPAAKPEQKTGTMVQGSVPPSKPSVPPVQGAVPIPRPSSAPVAMQGASRPPVNPFGGTMLMGAVADVPAAARAGTGDVKAFEATALAEPEVRPAAPVKASITTSQDQAAALSTTTPSVAPPAPVNPEKLPSDMATVASAVAPAIEPVLPPAVPVPAAVAAQSDWGQAVATTANPLVVGGDTQLSAPDSLALTPRQKSPTLALRLVLGILTLGLYPLIIWLARGRQSKPKTEID